MEYKLKKNVLINKMRELGYIPGETAGKKILIIRELETALFFAPENLVVYVTDDRSKHDMFNMFTETDCGDDDMAILIDGTEFRYEKDGELISSGIMKTWNNLDKILELLPE